MKLKTVEIDGVKYAVVQDDKPVFITDEGKDIAVDAAHSATTITRLNAENKAHREGKEAAEAKLASYGDMNVDDAKKALETVGNLSKGELKTHEQVEEIKREARLAAENQVAAAQKSLGDRIKELETENQSFRGDYESEVTKNAFNGSKFIKEKVSWPADAVQKIFGGNFKIEEKKLIGYDGEGNKLYSRAKPGEVADFEEAVEIMVERYPYADQILKGNGSSGTGKRDASGRTLGAKQMTRAYFNTLTPAEQMKSMTQDGTTVVD